jgi:transposase
MMASSRKACRGEEIKACADAGVTVTLPKPMTSGAKAEGRFGKRDFVYLAEEDVYRCPAREKLTYRMTTVENGQRMRRYWTSACRACPLKGKCTKGPERRIARWEHERVVEALQERLDENPEATRTRRETVEHPFGTPKMRMGATHFLCRTLPTVATETALCVLGYNMTREPNIVGVKPLLAAIAA